MEWRATPRLLDWINRAKASLLHDFANAESNTTSKSAKLPLLGVNPSGGGLFPPKRTGASESRKSERGRPNESVMSSPADVMRDCPRGVAPPPPLVPKIDGR